MVGFTNITPMRMQSGTREIKLIELLELRFVKIKLAYNIPKSYS